ncbi:hypothetical protein A9975_26300 [Cupriavidus sp. UME77]|nr:hypothetical protein [Cupriavidus sp. UME77]
MAPHPACARLGCARLATRARWPRLVGLYMQGKLPLDAINEGFSAMQSGHVARSVIVFPGFGGLQ